MSVAAGIDSTAGRAEPLAPERDFDALPPERLVRAFGVEYAHVHPPEGGDLYVTREGWAHVEALLPGRWYAGERYAREGVRLRASSGTVYHLRIPARAGPAVDLVVKFSRVAQDVPLVLETQFPAGVPPEAIAAARFNSPLEEFGLLTELRRVARRTAPRLLMQRPLAIYAPSEEFDLWQLGRQTSSFHTHRLQLAEDQSDAPKAIELDIRRIYVMLFGWIGGRDAEECHDEGWIDAEELRAVSARAAAELERAGFFVLDHKPRHVILRPRPGGPPLRHRDGRLAYGLVDFELLQRTPEQQQRYRADRRERFWRLQSGRAPDVPEPPEPRLRTMRAFGVEYRFGTTPDGGRIWVLGREPGLFDYFLPDRWRRTPREKLSASGEVYHTRSRDQVDIVYRRSRVGLLPRVDPLSPEGKRIRAAGYNSPFEELALAVRLRELGIRTAVPRAIYETAHETVKSFRLRDLRRYAEHAHLVTPEEPPRPALRPDHDYYTIWDTFRGARADATAGSLEDGGGLSLEHARERGELTAAEADAALARARRSLARTALPPDGIADDEFVVALDAAGRPVRDAGGARLRFALDALTAYDFGILSEREYLDVVRRMDEKLRAADFEKLDPNGRHLLLSVDCDGRPVLDPAGGPHVVLANFALVRGLYRPLR